METNGIEVFLAGVFCYAVGFVGGDLIGSNHSSNPEPQIEQAQIYNYELQPQLQVGQRLVAHLIVNESGNTYKFETVGPDKQNETCTGDYKVDAKGVARATGALACTAKIPLNNPN